MILEGERTSDEVHLLHACPKCAGEASLPGSADLVVHTSLLEVFVPVIPSLTGSFIISCLHSSGQARWVPR